MKYIGVIIMGVICMAFIGPILIVGYYYFKPVWERALWKLKGRVKVLRPMVTRLPVKINEDSLKEFNEQLNDRIRQRVSDKIDLIKTITTTIGPDGICYLTVWYNSKEYDLKKKVGEDLMKVFKYDL